MNDYYRRFKHFLYRDFTPLTKLAIIAAFFFSLLSLSRILPLPLWFESNALFFRPWTLLTYPLINTEIFSLIFGGLWLWFIGSGLERTWGTPRYGFFILFTTLGTALSTAVISLFLRLPAILYGLWIPLVGITWAWADLHPDRELLFWGILPVKARWLAWIQAALVFFPFARLHLALGLAVLVGIPISYLFRGKGPFSPWRRWTPGRFSLKSWWEHRRREKRRNRFKVVK